MAEPLLGLKPFLSGVLISSGEIDIPRTLPRDVNQ
jgi:hypothetical protein